MQLSIICLPCLFRMVIVSSIGVLGSTLMHGSIPDECPFLQQVWIYIPCALEKIQLLIGAKFLDDVIDASLDCGLAVCCVSLRLVRRIC